MLHTASATPEAHQPTGLYWMYISQQNSQRCDGFSTIFCEVYMTFALAFASAVGSCIVYSALVPLAAAAASNSDETDLEVKLGAPRREDQRQVSGLSIWWLGDYIVGICRDYSY